MDSFLRIYINYINIYIYIYSNYRTILHYHWLQYCSSLYVARKDAVEKKKNQYYLLFIRV